MRRELVQLFTSWPANRSPRDKVVDISIWMLDLPFANYAVSVAISSIWHHPLREAAS